MNNQKQTKSDFCKFLYRNFTPNSFAAKKSASRQSHLETYINTRLSYKFDVFEERHTTYASDDRNP